VEKQEEVNRILTLAAKQNKVDLEAWETGLRRAVLAAGAQLLGDLIAGIGCGRLGQELPCSCGGRMHSKGRKKKKLLTILGELWFWRSRFQCDECGAARYPGDEALDIVGTSRSPGLRRLMARAGSKSTFREGCEDLKVYAEITVSPKDVERVAEGIGRDVEAWAGQERQALIGQPAPLSCPKTIPVMYIAYDGTGVPMIASERLGRRGKQPDGSARTREAKLGCVFTQTTTDQEDRPVRDPDSTSFVGAIETAEEFGWRIYAEAIRRGLWQAEQVVILGDGAVWIRNLAEMHFPGATRIIDLYHAREHVSDLCKLLFDPDVQERHYLRWWDDLDAGKVEKIVREAQKALPANKSIRKEAEKQLAYLERNREQMRYADFRARGFFVGSGVVEAGCKSVIGQRLKQSGMEWSKEGANAIISLRSIIVSGRFEQFWEDRSG